MDNRNHLFVLFKVTPTKLNIVKIIAPFFFGLVCIYCRCGHCKRMAKDWERLAGQWEDSKIGLVAEVDCTDKGDVDDDDDDDDDDDEKGGGGGKRLCNHFGIESFPTIKYGDPNDLQDYNGKRSLQEMSEFAEERLIPICSPTNLKLCDDEALAKMKQYLDLSINELHQFIALEEEKLKEAEVNFETTVDRLTKEYEVAEKVKRSMIEEISNGDLNLMKQILLKKEVFTDNRRRESNDNEDDEINNEL
jgi:thiol-disulfide isomerase/thioredoxin